jgi:SAM-dependent methyltransferase
MLIAPAEQATLPQAHFDRVVMSHVIEHLSDPLEALTRVRAAMKGTGELVIRAPNFDSLERLIFGRWWSGLDIPRHLQHFSKRTLTRLLDHVGLHTVSTRPQLEYASMPLSVALLLKALSRRTSQPSPTSRGYLACLPISVLARAAGAAGTIELEARPR